MERGDSFEDAMVSDPVQREVSIHEDRGGAWCVEYFDEDATVTSRSSSAREPRHARAIISMPSELDG
jgi:hypothetical protein